MILVRIIGISAGTGSHDNISQLYMLLHTPAGADPDQILHSIHMNQLIRIDPDGRTSHACPHDGYFFPFTGSRITEHVPNRVELHCILQKRLRDHLRPKRISRQQYGLRNIPHFCRVMWCWHNTLLIWYPLNLPVSRKGNADTCSSCLVT